MDAANDRPALDRGVYAISTAAELAGTGVQNLRLYEKRGLLTPSRTSGGTRLYSQNDVGCLLRIGSLLDAGLNLAGIAMVLELERQVRDVEDERDRLREGRRRRKN